MEEDYWYNNPKLVQRPSCTLQANGINFDAKLFLSQTTFDRQQIIYDGILELPEEIKRKLADDAPEGIEVFETTFLLLSVSESERRTMQFEEALIFLRKHREEILRLSKFPKVEEVLLKFMTVDKGESPIENLPKELEKLIDDCDISSLMI